MVCYYLLPLGCYTDSFFRGGFGPLYSINVKLVEVPQSVMVIHLADMVDFIVDGRWSENLSVSRS